MALVARRDGVGVDGERVGEREEVVEVITESSGGWQSALSFRKLSLAAAWEDEDLEERWSRRQRPEERHS